MPAKRAYWFSGPKSSTTKRTQEVLESNGSSTLNVRASLHSVGDDCISSFKSRMKGTGCTEVRTTSAKSLKVTERTFFRIGITND